MQFGFMLSHEYLLEEDVGGRLQHGVQQAELCRDLGYDLLLSHHHYLADLQIPQPVPVLAHLIPYSGTMRLGIGIYAATLDHPVQVAENFATIDQLSGGRLVMGVGAGYREAEFTTLGIDRETRWSRLEETISLLRDLWTGERVTFNGQHFTIDNQRIGLRSWQQDPVPPIWIGANAPRTIARTAGVGDAWLASPNVKFAWANGNLAMFRDELERNGIEPAGREYPIIREVYIADSDDAARKEVREYLQHSYDWIDDPTFAAKFDELFDKAFLVGSPDTVAERVGMLAAAGWTCVIARAGFPGMPAEMTMTALERFGTEVMPQFTPLRQAPEDTPGPPVALPGGARTNWASS